MNCEICKEKFSNLNDLVQHGLSKRHRYSHFFCMPCVQAFDTVTDVVEHTGSVEHSVMALATGIHFSTEDKDPDFPSAPFPPHTCCLVCGFRGFLPIEEHVESETHNFLAFVMRTIIKEKEIRCSGKYTTQMFISKMINLKQKELNASVLNVIHGPLPFTCELCNVHFGEPAYYTQHVENQYHKRMEQFMNKVFHIVKEVDIIDVGSHKIISKTFSNSLSPLYYCEMCCLWMNTSFRYAQHKKSDRHKNVESLAKNNKRAVTALRNAAHISRDPKKRKRHLESEGYGKCVQCKHKSEALVSNKLKVSSSPLNPKVDERDEKNVVSLNSNTPSGVEANETKSNSSLDDFETSDSSVESEVDNISNPEEHYCELCDFLTYSKLHFGRHLISKHHKRMKKISIKKQEKASDSTQVDESADK